jgi:hypothetical protein
MPGDLARSPHLINDFQTPFRSTPENPCSLLIPALSVAYVDHPGTFQ